jgi:integrase
VASLSNDPGGARRVLVVVDGDRKTVRLGKIPKKQAESILRHIEALAAARIDGSSPREETARWLADVSDELRGRLVRAGLATPKLSPRFMTLGQLCDLYRERKFPGFKESTRVHHKIAEASILAHFGARTPLSEITAGDAEDFRDKLLAAKKAEATVRKRCAIASKLLRYAIKHQAIDRNPFDDGDVPRGNVGSPRQQFIDRETALGVLEELPNAQWRLLFSLSRWGGLRVGSEPRHLEWENVDWARERIHVPSPKTERYAGRGRRTIPLFPELRAELDACLMLAEEGEPLVLPFLRGRTDASLRATLERAIKRAGAASWPRLWHNLRASRQTELERDWPSHVVCNWLGNTKAVAEKHYLMVTEADFSKAAHIAAQTGAKPSATEGKPKKQRSRNPWNYQGLPPSRLLTIRLDGR